MSVFEVSAILIVLTAILSFINARFIRLPTMIGLMFLSLVPSLALAMTGGAAWGVKPYAARLLAHVDFNQALLHGMLAFLLFAGSLKIDLNDLRNEWGAVATLSLIGTALSTLAIGGGLWLLAQFTRGGLPFIECLLFGALISPTDPVAVLGILKSAGAPRSIETLMAGESLFNDGVGVVFFFVVLETATSGATPTFGGVARMLAWEAGGGMALGLAAGFVGYQFIRRIDNYQVEVMLTLAVTMGGYSLGEAIGVSAPLAMVVAGLFIGNRGRAFGMSEVTQDHLDKFWELIDEILNAVLFMLLGLELLVLQFKTAFLIAGAVAIALSLSARWASVESLVRLMRLRRDFCPGTVSVLTWGGLRGGLSVAMALSLPASRYRELILAVTYCVVVFSVLVQGLTVSHVTRRACRMQARAAPATSGSSV